MFGRRSPPVRALGWVDVPEQPEQIVMQRLGEVQLPVMTAELKRLWDLALTLAERLEPTQWSLVSAQMVALHALHAGSRGRGSPAKSTCSLPITASD